MPCLYNVRHHARLEYNRKALFFFNHKERKGRKELVRPDKPFAILRALYG